LSVCMWKGTPIGGDLVRLRNEAYNLCACTSYCTISVYKVQTSLHHPPERIHCPCPPTWPACWSTSELRTMWCSL
jgi:hypothetical protein